MKKDEDFTTLETFEILQREMSDIIKELDYDVRNNVPPGETIERTRYYLVELLELYESQIRILKG